jgi:NADPH:quinone reductase-like Zn-dependent oxidoreductase
LAGEIAVVGAAVSEFTVGDHVFGVNPCRFGAHAEFICVRESGALARMSPSLSFEEGAAVCDEGILALQGLRSAQLRRGQHILIYDASGSIGTAGVQLAKYLVAGFAPYLLPYPVSSGRAPIPAV